MCRRAWQSNETAAIRFEALALEIAGLVAGQIAFEAPAPDHLYGSVDHTEAVPAFRETSPAQV